MTILPLASFQSGQTHVVSQFHVVEWAGDILPLCEAVEEVLRVLSTNKHAPVLIHCRWFGWVGI